MAFDLVGLDHRVADALRKRRGVGRPAPLRHDKCAPPAAHARELDVVARMGGDEFAIIMTQMEQATDAAALSKRIRELGD